LHNKSDRQKRAKGKKEIDRIMNKITIHSCIDQVSEMVNLMKIVVA
tara:strand:- start:79 stop:216 length:138 start_codon:yes stop_codon:yes gene_type:complete